MPIKSDIYEEMEEKQILKFFNFNIPTGEIKETDGVETWIVSWKMMTGFSGNYPDICPCYQAFTNMEKANEYKKAIKQAHKLIGNTINTEVSVKKQIVGL